MNATPQNDNPFALDPTSFVPAPVPGTNAAKKSAPPKVVLRRTAEPQTKEEPV